MTMVIAGAGLAGAKACEMLRAQGFAGRIILIGDEPELPYERPPLSKGLLLGTAERDSVYVFSRDWYKDNEIELRLGTAATGIDRQGKAVRLSDGDSVPYQKLLLATGSRPRKLELPGVHYLRTLADSDVISAQVTAGKHVAVIGAGWIGLEIAAAARARDARVSIIEMAQLPLQGVLGDKLGAVFAGLHQKHGVTFHFGAMAAPSLISELRPDFLVAGAGIRPNTELAQEAGLNVDNGIVTDESFRTSDPDIFAAGDVANAFHPLLRRHIRVEHWANALNSGPAAARSMLGEKISYELLPYFYTDQYELGMEYSGYAAPGDYDEVTIRGSIEALEFVAYWKQAGRVLAGMNVNVWDVQDEIQDLIRKGL